MTVLHRTEQNCPSSIREVPYLDHGLRSRGISIGECRCQQPLKWTLLPRFIASAATRLTWSPFETWQLSSHLDDSRAQRNGCAPQCGGGCDFGAAQAIS